jgi:hypothetical protein
MLPVADRELVGTDEAAQQLGVSPVSLRRWERLGLVTPTMRTPGSGRGRGHARWDLDSLREQISKISEGQ